MSKTPSFLTIVPTEGAMPSDVMRCAMVALVGIPNVGKSTLINALVGQSVGIISPKVNTTRLVVRGIQTQGDTQLIWLDTPGLIKGTQGANASFQRQLVQQAEGALAEADVVVLLAEATNNGLSKAAELVKRIGAQQGFVLALTKTDRIKEKTKLLPLLQNVQAWPRQPSAVVPLALPPIGGSPNALKSGLAPLYAAVSKLAPAGPWLFPAGQTTDQPLPLHLAEVTRAQAMRSLHQEIPYGLAVRPVSYQPVPQEPTLVQQEVLVTKPAHKAMVIGHDGQMLQRFGRAARLEMQRMLGVGVRLELRVTVMEDWQTRPDVLRDLGISG